MYKIFETPGTPEYIWPNSVNHNSYRFYLSNLWLSRSHVSPRLTINPLIKFALIALNRYPPPKRNIRISGWLRIKVLPPVGWPSHGEYRFQISKLKREIIFFRYVGQISEKKTEEGGACRLKFQAESDRNLPRNRSGDGKTF